MQVFSDTKRRTRTIVLVLIGLSVLLYKGCTWPFSHKGYISRFPDQNPQQAQNNTILSSTPTPIGRSSTIMRSGFGSTGRHFSFFGG